jgi:hypothetical protein
VSRDFLLQVFSRTIFPQALENNFMVIPNFFENLRKYSQARCTTGTKNTGDKFATAVSTTPAANFVTCIVGVVDTGVNDTGGKFGTGLKKLIFELKFRIREFNITKYILDAYGKQF